MIYSRSEIAGFIKSVLGDEGDYKLSPLVATGNMTARLEDGGEATLLSLVRGQEEYAIKMKSRLFEDNVLKAMNYYDDSSLEQGFSKGKYVFYIRDAFNREEKIYSALSAFGEYLPRIYGAQSDDYRSIILMEKLKISRAVKALEVITFLTRLHKFCTSEKRARELGANIPTKEDYLKAQDLSISLISNVSKAYANFPSRILNLALDGVKKYGELYDRVISFPRALCHGDCTAYNMTTEPILKVYDFELSTFNNPEFDLISYLVHYPTPLKESDVDEFLGCYYGEKDYLATKKEVLKLNLLVYFVTRFHAMMMIAKTLDMPYMEISIKNYIFLFDYFGF